MLANWGSDSSLDPEDVHEVLRNDRRRRTLKYLKQRIEPVPLRDLSERVAELEADASPAPRNLRQSVYNSLHQTHLPKLDDYGIVDYERDRKVVSLEARAKDIDVYMGISTPVGVTWATYYRSVGVAGLLAVVLSEVGAPLVSALEPLVFATVFLFLLAASAAFQLWTRRWFYVRSWVPTD
jgi:hypothetical protein